MRFSLRANSYAGRRLILSASEIEHTRQRSDPRAGPLVGYVVDENRSVCWGLSNELPTKDGVFARVTSEITNYTVGWAPLEAVAKALESGITGSGDNLREAGPSDTSRWTVAMFGARWTIVRTSYAELVAAHADDLQLSVTDEDDEIGVEEEEAELEAAMRESEEEDET
jgi:hypothetical protein